MAPQEPRRSAEAYEDARVGAAPTLPPVPSRLVGPLCRGGVAATARAALAAREAAPQAKIWAKEARWWAGKIPAALSGPARNEVARARCARGSPQRRGGPSLALHPRPRNLHPCARATQ